MSQTFTFSAIDFNPELISDGADELLGLIDNNIDDLRHYSDTWQEIIKYDDNKVLEQFEDQVFKEVIKRLRKEHNDEVVLTRVK